MHRCVALKPRGGLALVGQPKINLAPGGPKTSEGSVAAAPARAAGASSSTWAGFYHILIKARGLSSCTCSSSYRRTFFQRTQFTFQEESHDGGMADWTGMVLCPGQTRTSWPLSAVGSEVILPLSSKRGHVQWALISALELGFMEVPNLAYPPRKPPEKRSPISIFRGEK